MDVRYNNLVWEPVIAVECVVPWEILSNLPPREDRADFCSPYPVRCNAELLFNIHLHHKKTRIIEGVLRQPSSGHRSRELLVKSRVSWTSPSPKREDDHYMTLLIPDKSQMDTKDTLKIMDFCYFNLKQPSFTLKLWVYAAPRVLRGVSITESLNVARRSGSPLCDIQLRVGDHDFPAHKAVLSATSCVFKAMFCGDFKEKYAETVVIEDVSKEAFGKFLDFLYLQDICWKGSELELLGLSERYQVEQLKARCEMCLWELDGLRALGILIEADKWPVVTDTMKKRLCEIVMANLGSVVKSNEWQTLQSSSPVLASLVEAGASRFAIASSVNVKVFHELARW
ncbi:kelch-like ECH-associated protein 1B [Thrips palmi]|uniref:Kelch-like ECH-associated protein 1B n=1 Tax=Thrips palmi TaxID=161013 RepID=A0A6P8ZD45_THRPL|nr:kelch-like ECH-associated protein 1B [Thrips palmi]